MGLSFPGPAEDPSLLNVVCSSNAQGKQRKADHPGKAGHGEDWQNSVVTNPMTKKTRLGPGQRSIYFRRYLLKQILAQERVWRETGEFRGL